MKIELLRIAFVLAGLIGGLMVATTALACSLSGWSSSSGTPIANQPNDSPPVARYSGFCAMQADEIGDFVTDNSPQDEDIYFVRFYVYTGTHTGGNVDIFQARNDVGANMIRVQYSGTQLTFMMGGTGTSRTATVVPNRWYSIELDWEAAAPGGLSISVQGAGSATPISVTPISGINNESDRITEARMGKIAGAGAGFMNFDAFDSRGGLMRFDRGAEIFEDGFEEVIPD
jgi:hypothetical protein